jgi:hypothetical protein
MVVFFGTGFYGRIYAYHSQWIETRFFSIMFLPVFPISSMYVTSSSLRERKGVDIRLNARSVLLAYARTILTPIAIFCLIGFTFMRADELLKLPFFLALLSIIGCVYFWFFFGKTNDADKTRRKKFGSVTGLYALPQWLDHSTLQNLYDRYKADYKQLYPDTNWKTDLKSHKVDPHKYPLLYVLAQLDCVLNGEAVDEELFVKADRLYDEGG